MSGKTAGVIIVTVIFPKSCYLDVQLTDRRLRGIFLGTKRRQRAGPYEIEVFQNRVYSCSKADIPSYAIWTKVKYGKLTLTPMSNPKVSIRNILSIPTSNSRQKVLDIGTGTGLWPMFVSP